MEVEALQAILMDDIKGFAASSKLLILGTRPVDSNSLSEFDRFFVSVLMQRSTPVRVGSPPPPGASRFYSLLR